MFHKSMSPLTAVRQSQTTTLLPNGKYFTLAFRPQKPHRFVSQTKKAGIVPPIMRPVIILLGVLTIVLGVVCIQQRHADRDHLSAAQEQARITSDTLRAAQIELTTFKSQMVQQVTTLEGAVATAEQQRRQAQQQTETLKQELAAARKAAQEQKDQLTTLEQEKEKLVAESAAIAEQLRTAKQQLAAQEKAPPAAGGQPNTLSDQQVRLELASLKARWNNLAALQAQVRVVKKQLEEERIAKGNRGILLHDGKWNTATPEAHPSP
jgi:hypothetical protein